MIVAEKQYFNKPIPVTGKIILTELVKFEEADYEAVQNTSRKEKESIVPLLNTMSQKLRYRDAVKEKYDFSMLNDNWASFTEFQQYKELNSKFTVDYVGNDIYEFVLRLSSEDPKNAEYVKENGSAMLHSYVEFSNSLLGKYLNASKATVLDKSAYYEEHTSVANVDFTIKYAVIGFALGVILAISLICVWTYKKG